MAELNYKLMFYMLLGVTVGLAFVADSTINEVIDLVNDCRVENHKLKYPEAYEQENLRYQAVADLMNQTGFDYSGLGK